MRKPHNRYVAYYRVSTAEQGRSGLGLEAQREAVARFFNGDGWEAIAEFTEVESGKRGDRPQLEKALAASRLHRCPLVVAKMDRLTRSVSFLSRLLEAGVDVRFADLPAIEGPTGRFMLQQMAAVAELEAGLISSRTKAALAAAKARGKVLGGNRGTALSEQAQAIGRAVQIKRASERAADLRPMIRDLQQSGVATALRNRTSAKRARRANGTWWALLDSHPGRTGVRETAATLVCSQVRWVGTTRFLLNCPPLTFYWRGARLGGLIRLVGSKSKACTAPVMSLLIDQSPGGVFPQQRLQKSRVNPPARITGPGLIST